MLALRLSRLVTCRPPRSAVQTFNGVDLLKNKVLLKPSRKPLSSSSTSALTVNLANVGSASLVGQRRSNEDRFKSSRAAANILYFAVFDGHGGREAADFCQAHMEQHVKRLVRETQNLEVALTKAFIEVDKALAQQSPACHSGTTATAALLRDDTELVVASVGDSRALLCREGKALQLTKDHTPDRKDERERIERCGGFVVWSSCGDMYVNGRLAMTRSIGDFPLKKFGVIAEPETKRVLLRPEQDSFLALITDGISVIMKIQEICNVINQSHDANEAAQRVCEQALAHGSKDNVTIVVVPFGTWRKSFKSE